MKIQNQKFLTFVCASLLALVAGIALAGCAHFQAWGQKTSGSPATMGGAFNIPLGK